MNQFPCYRCNVIQCIDDGYKYKCNVRKEWYEDFLEELNRNNHSVNCGYAHEILDNEKTG